MLRAHKFAGLTAPAPQAGGALDAKAQRWVLQRAGLVLGFVLLVVLGSIWAVANVQYFDRLEAASPARISPSVSSVSVPDKESPQLVARQR